MKRVRFGIRFRVFGAFRNAGIIVLRLSAAEAMRLVNLVTEVRVLLRMAGHEREAEMLVCEVEDA